MTSILIDIVVAIFRPLAWLVFEALVRWAVGRVVGA